MSSSGNPMHEAGIASMLDATRREQGSAGSKPTRTAPPAGWQPPNNIGGIPAPVRREGGRGHRIRTDGLLRPRQTLYQAELVPEKGVHGVLLRQREVRPYQLRGVLPLAIGARLRVAVVRFQASPSPSFSAPVILRVRRHSRTLSLRGISRGTPRIVLIPNTCRTCPTP